MLSTKVFSSSDDIQSRKKTCDTKAVQPERLEQEYEIDRCVLWVLSNKFTKVALQFPDELLVNAQAIAELLQGKLQTCVVFILGDTTYGSCCVDEVGAQHYGASCIIHYGHACLSPTSVLPVLYVFLKSEVDTEDCFNQMKETCLDCQTKAVLVCDPTYQHAMGEIYSKLKNYYKHVISSNLLDSQQTNSHIAHGSKWNDVSKVTVINKCGHRIELPLDDCISDYSFIYIGRNQSPALTCMMMTFNKCQFYTYDPSERVFRWEQVNVNKALMRRYYLIERAKDANIIGIVVGTLGVSRYRDMINQMKTLLKKTGKKSYTFVVGKLNPAKLANFAEVDLYVLVSCPESSLFDQSEFYQPIISPLELEIACNQARQWTGDYSLDFSELLPGSAMYVEAPDVDKACDDWADVSLINSRVRTIGIQDMSALSECTVKDISLTSASMAVAIGARDAGEYLSSRSWKGLEQKLGETAVVKAVEGQHGVAAGYENEPQQIVNPTHHSVNKLNDV